MPRTESNNRKSKPIKDSNQDVSDGSQYEALHCTLQKVLVLRGHSLNSNLTIIIIIQRQPFFFTSLGDLFCHKVKFSQIQNIPNMNLHRKTVE